MVTRTVDYYEYTRESSSGKYTPILKGEATFHQFGSDYEEFESGAGNFSTAIIELQDGTIKNIPAELIKFKKD